LRDVASQYGEVKEITMPRDKETKRFRGFAFVTFSKSECARQMMEDAQHGFVIINGRTVTSDIPDPLRKPAHHPAGQDKKPKESQHGNTGAGGGAGAGVPYTNPPFMPGMPGMYYPGPFPGQPYGPVYYPPAQPFVHMPGMYYQGAAPAVKRAVPGLVTDKNGDVSAVPDCNAFGTPQTVSINAAFASELGVKYNPHEVSHQNTVKIGFIGRVEDGASFMCNDKTVYAFYVNKLLVFARNPRGTYATQHQQP